MTTSSSVNIHHHSTCNIGDSHAQNDCSPACSRILQELARAGGNGASCNSCTRSYGSYDSGPSMGMMWRGGSVGSRGDVTDGPGGPSNSRGSGSYGAYGVYGSGGGPSMLELVGAGAGPGAPGGGGGHYDPATLGGCSPSYSSSGQLGVTRALGAVGPNPWRKGDEADPVR